MGTDTQDTEAIARGVFAEIAKRFPTLQMIENHDDPASGVTSKAANGGHFKTGQRKVAWD